MGIKRKSETVRWTEELMQQHLLSFRSTARYVLQNLYVFGWESDILFLSKSGFWTEIEIKVSRSDFKADAKNKIEKHSILSTKDNHFKPNQFFYAVPKGLVLPDEIPEYAGLLEIRNRGFHPEIKIPAPWLHRHKINPDELNLTDKFYYNMIESKRKAIEAEKKISELTEPYRQGFLEGKTKVIAAAQEVMKQRCPYRTYDEMNRIHCLELNQTRYTICNQGLCNYLSDWEDKLERQIKS